MIILGLSFGFHDAAATLINNNKILFAAHAERYSKVKNDPWLNHELIRAALEHGTPELITVHEKSWSKRLRKLSRGDWRTYQMPTLEDWIRKYYPELRGIPIESHWHHESHAAAGAMAAPSTLRKKTAIMCIDAIGEWDTATIWQWYNDRLDKVHSTTYPNSLGLMYSAATHYVGLKPMEDEYILMGMAAYGDKNNAIKVREHLHRTVFKQNDNLFLPRANVFAMKRNLHRGFTPGEFGDVSDFDIARGVQEETEARILAYAYKAQQLCNAKNLIFMGGCALNCVANEKLTHMFKRVYIMPNPGDAGSSLGAAALSYYNRTGDDLFWETPYLGYNIEGGYPIEKALSSLRKGEIFGIANGRAEFGPRALGNRSLLADPRGKDIKDAVNKIKKRQEFRPFAPVIMEEYAHDFFEMPQRTSPYMQFTAECLYPDEFPAITHADGTSRVQTVNEYQHSELYNLLQEFYNKTGCPMLLNTSLNIKGQPIVNDEQDAQAFERLYQVDVHLHS